MERARTDPVQYVVAVGVIGAMVMIYPPSAILILTVLLGVGVIQLFMRVTAPADEVVLSGASKAGATAMSVLLTVSISFVVGLIASLMLQFGLFMMLASVAGFIGVGFPTTMAVAEIVIAVWLLVMVARAWRNDPDARTGWVSGGLGFGLGVVLVGLLLAWA